KEYYQELISEFYSIVAIFQALKNIPIFINKLINENQEIIKSKIENYHLLIALLSSVNKECRLSLLTTIGVDFINSFSNECNNLKERLVKLLPESQRSEFLEKFTAIDKVNQLESFSKAMPALTQHAGLLKHERSIEHVHSGFVSAYPSK